MLSRVKLISQHISKFNFSSLTGSKVVSIEKALSHVKDGNFILIGGFCNINFSLSIFKNNKKLYSINYQWINIKILALCGCAHKLCS